MRVRAVALIVPFVVLASPQAGAQSASAAAQQIYEDGRALLQQGKVHEACLKFVESDKLDPQLGTLLNAATCHEKEGKVATAWGEYNELFALATKKSDGKRATYSKRKIAELQGRLAHLTLTVPAGVDELAIDGIPLGQAAWSTSLPVDAGDHLVVYSGAGKKPASLKVSAADGASTRVVLPALDDAPLPVVATVPSVPAVEPTRPAPIEPPPSSEKHQPLRTAGVATLGIGVLGLGLGAVTGALALGKKSTVNTDCTGNQCSQSGLDAVSSARTLGTMSTVGFVAGGALVAIGATMFMVGRRQSVTVGLSPVPSRDGAGFVTFGTF